MNRGIDYPSVPSDLEQIWEVDRPRVLRISNVGMIIILPFEGEAGETFSDVFVVLEGIIDNDTKERLKVAATAEIRQRIGSGRHRVTYWETGETGETGVSGMSR
jgi:hypothetical protein